MILSLEEPCDCNKELNYCKIFIVKEFQAYQAG